MVYTGDKIGKAMGNKIIQQQLGENKKSLTVDDTEYELTPGLHALIMQKHPQPT